MSNFIATTRPSKNLFDMFATTGITLIDANTFTVKVVASNSSGQTTNMLSALIPSLQVGDIIYVNYDCDYADWEELRFGITTKAPKNTPITVTQYMLDNPIRFYRKTNGTDVDIEIRNLIITKDSNTSYEPFGTVVDKHVASTVNLLVPIEYTPLEYIESSGKQYIDTGLFIDTTDALNGSEIVFAPTSLVVEGISYTESPAICGVISTSGYIGYQAIISANTGTLGGSGCTYDKKTIAVNEKVTVTLTTGNGIPNRNFALFCKNQGASGQTTITAASKSSGRLYSAKIMYKGELALNLVPAKRKADGAIGLYDMISGTFFTNAGTGDFVAGNILQQVHKYLISSKEVNNNV